MRTRHRRYCGKCGNKRRKLMKHSKDKAYNIQYYWCRPCNTETHNAYAKKHPEVVNKANRKYVSSLK